MASAVGNGLPSGGSIFTTMPEILFIPEFIFGGLTWCLVASTKVTPPLSILNSLTPSIPIYNPEGWVMFVCIFCFVFTTLWFFIFLCGGNQSSVWPGLDTAYHFIAVLFYLSSSVVLAYVTLEFKALLDIPFSDNDVFKIYRENIAAVVMSYVTTLLYFLHAIFSALRWKSS